MPRLTRELTNRDRPDVRIVHLGLGAFARAHQAWYTERAGGGWGIAGFTGRGPAAARALAPQGGLFTLLTRGEQTETEVIGCVAEVHESREAGRLAAAVARPSTALVTLTITEAGYRVDPRADPASTGLGRLALALEQRRRASGAPIALVSCDNVPRNGDLLGSRLLAIARAHLPELAAWWETGVSLVSTSVDRITPRTTATDRAEIERRCGWRDAAPVVTEPFADWILEGAFRGGRPPWEVAGARFVDDLEPFENRKLWLLNGAHSLLASAGMLRGYASVREAIDDDAVRAQVEELWDEAQRGLDADALHLVGYRRALLERFANPGIRHSLAQIATDAADKLTVRVIPVARRERAAGRTAAASASAVGAWIASVRSGVASPDARDAEIARASEGGDEVRALIRLLAPDLADDARFVDEVRDGARRAEEGKGIR